MTQLFFVHSFEWAIKRIDALKSLGITRVRLNSTAEDLPWDLVTNCAGDPLSISFDATHSSGIEFCWSVPLAMSTEHPMTPPSSAARVCTRILSSLPPGMRVKTAWIVWNKIFEKRRRAVALREEVAAIEALDREVGAAIKAQVLP